MLQSIHDRLTGIFAIVILIALGIVFVFWGVDASVGSFTRAQGIKVNGEEIGADVVRRDFQDELARYQQALGNVDMPDELRQQVRNSVVEQAVRNELIRQRTRELHYAVSDSQVLESIRDIPAFQVAGQFSPDAYHAALRSAAMNPASFEEQQRRFVMARQLDRGIYSSAFVLPGEFERRVALRDESREIGWVVLPSARFLGEVQLDDAAVADFYAGNRERWMTEELARLEYVEIDIDRMATEVSVGEEELRAWYEERIERYSQPGRRRASHILIQGEGDEARRKAQAAYERAVAGEDFAALARELSEDAGSAPQGGDLGWAERGFFVPAFAEAVWGMKQGEIRGPVRTEFGWHVIRLDEVQPGVTRSFEEVRAEIAPELQRAEVEKRFGDLQDRLDTLAFEAAGNLRAVADELGLEVRVVERFTRAGSPELGGSPSLVAAVFSPDTIGGRELRTVELEPGHVVAIRVAAHSPPRERPLAEVREQVVAAARQERARQLAAERAQALLAELAAGGDWQAVTRPYQSAGPVPTHQPRMLKRGDTAMPAELSQQAFRAPRPEGGARHGMAELASGDVAVWRVTAVRPGSVAGLSAEELRLRHEQAREQHAYADSAAYLRAMRATADVDVNQQIFE